MTATSKANLQVSVVIPTHNRLDLLKKLLQSLEEQTLSKDSFEVIVIPSPGDPSITWLNSYNKQLNLRVEVPKDDKWQGKNVSFKRNYGASITRSPWIAFIDDDCIADKNWLSNSLEYFSRKGIGGIEGLTQTPENSPQTLTWKGLQRLSQFGGYQTCNIFYKKDIFFKAGGFDWQNFPWFLEDTDLAWSVIDLGFRIESAPDCIVLHPVGSPAPWRLTHEARGTGLKVKLYQKHPNVYMQKGMGILRPSQYLYLFLQLLFIVSAILSLTSLLFFSFIISMLILLAHMTKLFYGLQFNTREAVEVSIRTFFYPPIAFSSFVIYAIKQKLSLKKSIMLLLQ